MSTARPKYNGTALPLLNTTETLFSTVTAFASGKNLFPLTGTKRFHVDIKNSHSGTLKEYKSDDRGTNWNQISETAIAAAAATGTNARDYIVGDYQDWKLDFVNDGTTQTTFEIDMSMSTERAALV